MARAKKKPEWPKRVFILPDQHYAPADDKEGGVDPKAEACALKAIEVVKPNIFVNIGDAGEWTSVSNWRYKKVKRPPLRYQMQEIRKDAEAVNAGLDKHDAVLKKVGCKEKHFIEGNHEVWLDNFIMEYPDFDGEYDVQSLLRLRQRGYKYHSYGRYLSLGHLNLYHGGHVNSVLYHAMHHLRNLGASVMYGHYHDQSTAKAATLGGYHGAWCIGCICKLDKPFMRGKPTNWSHNFAVVHLEKDGTFHVEIVEIYDGQCYLWGKKITV